MKLDKYVKIEEWFDSSLGQSTVVQRLDLKKPTLSKQTQNKRKYINFENGSHFICSFNLNNPETTVCIVFKMTNIASGGQLFVNSLIFFPFFSFICIQNSIPNNNLENEQSIRYVHILSNKQ